MESVIWAGESAWLPPCVVLVINDTPYGLMFTLRYSYRSCPLEFMCWTLEDGMMTNALFKGLYEEWSCVEDEVQRRHEDGA